jgi:hypothetical protein
MMIFKHLVMGWIQLRLIVFASFYGIFICGLFLEKIVGNIRDNNPGKKSPEDTSWFDTNAHKKYASNQSRILGFVERVIYIPAFHFFPELVLAWLALKTISQWKKWSEELGRIEFNTFLIGNGLSLIIAYVAYQMIRMALDMPSIINLCYYYILLVSSLLFLLIIKHFSEKKE